MEGVNLKLEETGEGYFYINENEEQIAKLVISISGDQMTAHHTEVLPSGEGKGLGKQLMAEMADYARKNWLKVVALCPFVHAQFKRHPELYKDILPETL
jgi:uncharacterized protein